jgi:hypothetical protein
MKTSLRAAAAVPLLLSVGCADVTSAIRISTDSRSATLRRSVLETVPCLQERVEQTLGVKPEVSSSIEKNATIFGTDWRAYLVAELPKGSLDGLVRDGVRVMYQVTPVSSATSRVRYWLEGKDRQRREILDEAFVPVELCGGTRDAP